MYHIYASDGTDYGVYPGDSPDAAFQVMLDMAGADESTAGSPDDWIIEYES